MVTGELRVFCKFSSPGGFLLSEVLCSAAESACGDEEEDTNHTAHHMLSSSQIAISGCPAGTQHHTRSKLNMHLCQDRFCRLAEIFALVERLTGTETPSFALLA